MKSFLITGATGFVGKSLYRELLLKGHSVRVAVRQVSDDLNSIVVGNIDQNTDWHAALNNVQVVIHLAARVHVMHDTADDPLREFRRVNTAGTEKLARAAAAAGAKRLVYVSSIKVNGEATVDKIFTEADLPCPQDPYGISKFEAEQALKKVSQETGLDIVVIRPPLIYGAGVKGNFEQMLRFLSKGIPLPLSLIKNQRSLVYIGNLVDALITCAVHPAAAGQTYLLSDGDDISTPDLLRELGKGLGCPAWLLPCPPGILKFVGSVTGRSDQIERLLGSLQVDSGKIRRELNWTPPYTVQQGLHATAEWYRTTYL
ncbi:MAG: SDR family oxidoreductase [Gallionellaceae bacterium]|jgi:nucleoside-diphosphate-sugar epimerase